jgi:hypothetical protein
MFKPKTFKPKTFKAKLMKVSLCLGLASLGGLPAAGAPPSPASQAEPAKESWQKEFDAVCAKTQDAMTLSQEELTELIRRCDALVPQIEKLDDSRRKVYLGRLQKCRGLYAYVLDAKKNEKK